MSVSAIEVPRGRVPSHLIDLFEEQEATLFRRNFHSSVSMDRKLFQKVFMNTLLSKLIRYYERPEVSLEFGTNIPFLIIIPHTFLNRQRQLALISNDGIRGEPILNLREPINNRGRVRPDRPYLLLDIDPGTQMMWMCINDSIEHIKSKHRGGLTLDEGIALAAHRSDILANHGIDLISTLTSDNLTPFIRYRNNSFIVGKHFPNTPSPPSDPFSSASSLGIIALPEPKPITA